MNYLTREDRIFHRGKKIIQETEIPRKKISTTKPSLH